MDKEELNHRIKNALEILQDNDSFRVGDLTFRTIDKKHFSVTGWSLKNDFKSITKKTSLIEINEIKILFGKMIQASHELSDFIKQRNISYHLDYDSNKSGIRICSEIDGHIHWKADIN